MDKYVDMTKYEKNKHIGLRSSVTVYEVATRVDPSQSMDEMTRQMPHKFNGPILVPFIMLQYLCNNTLIMPPQYFYYTLMYAKQQDFRYQYG